MGDSRDVVSSFSRAARKALGADLFALQLGETPLNWKPMPSVGPGVREIRVSEGGEFRLFYLANRKDGIYVLHAFRKKTRKTPRRDIDKARI